MMSIKIHKITYILFPDEKLLGIAPRAPFRYNDVYRVKGKQAHTVRARDVDYNCM